MDALKETAKIEHLQIKPSLIQATIETIKAGIKLDEAEIQAAAQRDAAAKKDKKKKERTRHRRFLAKKEAEDEQENKIRTYRAHEDRRFGLMVVGEQHRYAAGSKESERIIFPEQPPLDYSFCLLNTVEEIITEQEPPQIRRNYKQPSKTHDDRYITSSLRLSYNVLNNFEGFVNTMYKILDRGPFGLCWLDLSFNSIDTTDEDTFTQLPNLSILYLHGNRISDMLEVKKLMGLPSLHTLTLHGNPIEQDEGYRVSVLYYMPHLKHLDYFSVTKSDKASSTRFGPMYEKYWNRKHKDLLAKAQVLKESMEYSFTAKMMAGNDYELDFGDY